MDLENKVKQWFLDRGLENQDPSKQFLKLMEESAELFEGLAKGKRDLVMDALGDMQVVLIGLDMQLKNKAQIKASKEGLELLYLVSELGSMARKLAKHVNYNESQPPMLNSNMILAKAHINTLALLNGTHASACLEVAYKEIKDRKGKVVNGVYVKEEDLK